MRNGSLSVSYVAAVVAVVAVAVVTDDKWLSNSKNSHR